MHTDIFASLPLPLPLSHPLWSLYILSIGYSSNQSIPAHSGLAWEDESCNLSGGGKGNGRDSAPKRLDERCWKQFRNGTPETPPKIVLHNWSSRSNGSQHCRHFFVICNGAQGISFIGQAALAGGCRTEILWASGTWQSVWRGCVLDSVRIGRDYDTHTHTHTHADIYIYIFILSYIILYYIDILYYIVSYYIILYLIIFYYIILYYIIL